MGKGFVTLIVITAKMTANASTHYTVMSRDRSFVQLVLLMYRISVQRLQLDYNLRVQDSNATVKRLERRALEELQGKFCVGKVVQGLQVSVRMG